MVYFRWNIVIAKNAQTSVMSVIASLEVFVYFKNIFKTISFLQIRHDDTTSKRHVEFQLHIRKHIVYNVIITEWNNNMAVILVSCEFRKRWNEIVSRGSSW